MKSDNFHLIAEVSKRPALWNTSIAMANRKDSWISQWQDVASIMELDVQTCKKRFKRLRDTYRAEIRKIQQRRSGTCHWPYFRSLEFMRYIFDPDGIVPFPPEPFNFDEAVRRSQAQINESAFDSFVIDVDDDDDFDFEIMGDIFKQNSSGSGMRSGSVSGGGGGDSSSAGQDSGSELSLKKSLNVNTNLNASSNRLEDPELSPHLLSPMHLPPKHALLPRPPPVKRGRANKPSSSYDNIGNGAVSNGLSSTSVSVSVSDSTTPSLPKDDADYNFLVSLLPHMKTLTDMGNLKFRMEISRILLDIKHDEQASPGQRDLARRPLPKLTPAPISQAAPLPASTQGRKRPYQEAMEEEPPTKCDITSSGYVDSSMIECDVKIENDPLF